ncbi:MAG: hypothetical protein Q9169_000154 [Polycauliona sp. 2 TL-2023]
MISDAVLNLDAPAIALTEYNELRYDIRIQKRTPPASSAALLCCSHQLRTEISHTLSRRASPSSMNPLTFHLNLHANGGDSRAHEDVMTSMCWARIPAALPTNNDTRINVHVNLRARNARSMRFIGDGGLGPTAQTLLKSLARFFAYGLAMDERSTPSAPPNFVEELVIEVLPVEFSMQEVRFVRHRPSSRSELTGKLGMLNSVASSNLLVGKLGKILVTVDGEVKRSWDIVDEKEATVVGWTSYGWIDGI